MTSQDWEQLITGLQVEVYSNLTHVRAALRSAFQKPDVCLATSFYSDRADEHERITYGPGSYQRNRSIVATVGVRPVPPGWLAALRIGGRRVAVLRRQGA